MSLTNLDDESHHIMRQNFNAEKPILLQDEALDPDGLLSQINQVNDVELDSTMWKALRGKQFAKANELGEFVTAEDTAVHVISVGDIIKFGRVNFKVCALRCKGRIKEEC